MFGGRVSVGHPVDVGSGAVFTIHTDLNLPGIVPILWRRFYSTASLHSSFLGRGWIVPYFSSLRKVVNGFTFTDENGSEVIFPDFSDLTRGCSSQNFSANMELRLEDDFLVVTHWHHATSDIERLYFVRTEKDKFLLLYIDKAPGQRVSIKYDVENRPTKIVQELEQRGLLLTYQRNDLVSSVSFLGASGQTCPAVHYEYDEMDRLVKATDSSGNAVQYSYDGYNRLLSETNPLGSTFSFVYDKRGLCTYSSGNNRYMERRLRYCSAPKVTHVTDSQGNVTRYHLNSIGQVLQEIQPNGAVTTNQYDEHGRISSVLYPNGGTERYEYDEVGNLVAIIDPSGSRTGWTFNDNHQVICFEDGIGAKLCIEYDANGFVIGKTDPTGNTWHYKRDHHGLATEVVTPEGWRFHTIYGDRFQWREARDNISLIYRQEYGEFGHETMFFDADGVVRKIEYDARFKPSKIEHRNGEQYLFSWNPIGQMVKRILPGDICDVWGYDSTGQYVLHNNAAGHSMRLEYDSEGRLKAEEDYTGGRSEFEYDSNGKMVSEKSPDGRTYKYRYNLAGQLVSIEKPDGKMVTLAHDICGRVISRTFSDGAAEEFTYDALGGVVTAKSNGSTIILERNKFGRVTGEVQNGFRIGYAYDKEGRKTVREFPDLDASTLSKSFDIRGRLVAISDSTGVCQKWTWNQVDMLVERQCSGGITESFVYDTTGRVREQKVSCRYSHGANIFRRYTYDQAGNVAMSEDSSRGTLKYEYDQMSRLTRVLKGREVEEYYQYNQIDALLETHLGKRIAGAGGRTIVDGVRQLDYDVNGCLSSIQTSRGILRLSYDILDRLIKVSSSDGTEASYSYDAFGRRILKEIDGKKTQFLWEGYHLAASLEEGRKPEFYFFMNGKPFAQWSGKTRLTPVCDRMGRVLEVLSQDGKVSWACTLGTFGNLVSETGSDRSCFRYRGQYHDKETGFYYNLSRYFHPDLCDFISPDPLGVVAGSNFYAYPRNPLRWDDPYGLECDPSHTHEKDFDKAREKAFEKAGMTDPSKVEFTKVDPVTGTVVEFKGPGGAKVAYDTPHASPGPGHESPHVGWQTGGKRGAGGTERGNITYDGPQHPARSPVKGEGSLK